MLTRKLARAGRCVVGVRMNIDGRVILAHNLG